MRMSFTLDCNHRDVIPKKTALHYMNVQMLADTCTDKPGPYISMQAPDMTGVVPNVTIVTPKIVALTIGQRLSSNLEENSVNSPVTHESIHTIIINNKGGISHYYDYNA